MTLSRQNVLSVGVAAAVLTAVALAAANFIGDQGENGGAREYAFTLVVCLALAGGLFGWAIPRIERPARAGLIAGVLGVLSVAAYWTGLPFVLGPAAVVLGLLGRANTETRASGTIAVVLGGLTTVAAIAAVVFDQAS